jgi:hypothetical protein
LCYAYLVSKLRPRRPDALDARMEKNDEIVWPSRQRAERDRIFCLNRLQPIEKPRFGKINASKR